MYKYKNLVLLIILLYSSALFSAEGDTGWRNILGLGCHLNDGTCYIDIDGVAVGDPSCQGNNVRFSVDDHNGKTWLSIIQTAYLANRQIRLQISGCYSFQPEYPTFAWGRMNK